MTASQKAHVRIYQTTPDLIADAIREEIARGDAAPGQALRQEELAARFGVSRLPVRDALLRLEGEGLVVVYPNRGAYVTELSADEVAEIYDLRILLEGEALAQSVRRASTDDWRRIDAALTVAEHGAGDSEWSVADAAFHMALYAPSARPRTLALIATLRGTVDRYWRAYSRLPQQTAAWLADHRAITAAARERDADAAVALLASHLRRAGDQVVGGLRAPDSTDEA